MAGSVRKGRTLGAFGSTKQIPERYQFGTPEEISERVQTNYVTPPSTTPSSFQQIRPGPSGGDVNSTAPSGRSGNQKYGNPRRYA